MLRSIPYAGSRGESERLKSVFAAWCRERSYDAAAETLERDWERMVTFYDFPAEHWRHLRTTNVVESSFAALRLRTDAAKRFKRVQGDGCDLEDADGGGEQVQIAEGNGVDEGLTPRRYQDGIVIESEPEKVAA